MIHTLSLWQDQDNGMDYIPVGWDSLFSYYRKTQKCPHIWKSPRLVRMLPFVDVDEFIYGITVKQNPLEVLKRDSPTKD